MYNMHTFLICLDISVFCVILLSKRSSGADYRYEACVPRNCGNGPNISFPFYIPGLQESYCGYPGFALNCSQRGVPVLQLPENEYVVDDISYQTRSLKVYDAAVLNSYGTGCLPGIRNTTLPTARFGFSDNVTQLHLFSNCSNSLSENFQSHRVGCDAKGRDSWDLAIYDKDENIANIALENCERNVVAPVEGDGNIGPGNVDEVLRRGFVLNWTASDCSKCESSGGRCGFNATIYHFRCFCPDRPHSRRCRPAEKRHRSELILATAISGGGAVLLLCLLISFVLWQCKKRTKKIHFLSRNISSDPSSKSDIETGRSYFGIPVFSYTELEVATSNFDASKELGDGGFGAVYHGKLEDGREVAIKRLSRDEINLANLAVNRIQRHAFDELIDLSLGYDYDDEVKRMSTSVAELAFRCLQLEKDMRPSMDEVLDVLEEIRTGEESRFEDVREANDHNSVIWTETDDVVLLKNMKFQSSPNAVTDVWVSSSTITSSVG
ncbi:LEAF RUST 10 DISEASE-RESISTANCE LOCUS RECEPTOR-LIKE PROTEIN KINASE-like 1.2 [Sesamum alatum]|uniref:non-specific serine/threonine protein kinase n=1 Tax=Sesamum alatum TaxID=300844 RepID=A0AAE1Y5H0_9LAMI|nr:LEAF RUST 10 DISEASE-RESISTANCE LOCUS RECEPTOR-LIKE PROTEIN KINASE-like 1.2 [Sesamum alatum]